MITSDFARTMSRYNSWQNKSLYSAADTLAEEARNRDRGAFFASIRGTLSHLLWADLLWMSRLDGWEKPRASLEESANYVSEWADLKSKRRITDARINRWASALDDSGLAGSVTWFSAAAKEELTRERGLLVVHVFIHQTHHRGQVHAMLTAEGARPEATDLALMPGL